MLKNYIRSNSFKRVDHIIKRGRYYDNILSNVAKILSVTKTVYDSTESIFYAITFLSPDTLKYAFFFFGGNIRNLPYPKNQTVMVEITRKLCNYITKEV